jgi:hypothetical protein
LPISSSIIRTAGFEGIVMANFTRIKECTRRRTVDIVSALEAEIALRKQSQLEFFHLEKMLSAVLALHENDLPRFRLAEAITASNPFLKLRSMRCQKDETCSTNQSKELNLIEFALGRAPKTSYTGNDLIEQITCLGQTLTAHLHAGRRILIVSPSDEQWEETVSLLLRRCFPVMEIVRESMAVLTMAEPDPRRRDHGAVSISSALAAAQAAWRMQRLALETGLAEVRDTCSNLAALLAARQALADEITDLNIIHQRCDQLLSLSKSLAVHISELEAQTTKSKESRMRPTSPWLQLRLYLQKEQPVSSTTLEKELQNARRRRNVVDREADQLALEMISRQAFITETTRDLLTRLQQYAPTFAAADWRLSQERQRLSELKIQLDRAPAPPAWSEVMQSAKLVVASADDIYEPVLATQDFDLVVLLQGERLCNLSLYWAASLARTAVIIAFSGTQPSFCALSMHQSAQFWLGPTDFSEPQNAACGLKTGWAPTGRAPA